MTDISYEDKKIEECQSVKTKNKNRWVAFCAALTMLGVELPSSTKAEKSTVDLPTKGMKGLSNEELKAGLKLKNGRKKKRLKNGRVGNEERRRDK